MPEVNAKWSDCEFGIDTDGKLKLVCKIEHLGPEELPKTLQIIFALDCLAQIAAQSGLNINQLFKSIAKRQLDFKN